MMKKNVRLAEYSNYKIGGLARQFCTPESVEEIISAIKKWPGKIFVLGGGTNVLFSDDGFDGLVVKPDIRVLEKFNHEVRVGAGVSIVDLLAFCIEHELSGLEWAGGLPGTVGGAIRGNAGAFGGEMKDVVKEVMSLDISGVEPKVGRRRDTECRFGYRTSIFKDIDPVGDGKKEIIIEATLALRRGERSAIRAGIEEKIQYRQNRQPLEYPNIGSMFKNVDIRKISPELAARFQPKIKTDPFPVLPTAVLIDAAGLKGTRAGGAIISPKHPNFIVNVANASANDVRTLTELIRTQIKRQFGVDLEEEVIYVGF